MIVSSVRCCAAEIDRGELCAFVDAGNFKMEGTRKFEAELTIREGRVAWDLNGLSAVAWDK